MRNLKRWKCVIRILSISSVTILHDINISNNLEKKLNLDLHSKNRSRSKLGKKFDPDLNQDSEKNWYYLDLDLETI